MSSTLHVELLLKDGTVATLGKSKGKKPLGEFIAGLANRFLMDHAEGGLMLPNSAIASIEKHTGHSFSTANEVVAAFLKAKDREDGQVVVKATVDPAFLPNLEEVAKWRDVTIHELATDMFNHAMAEGWLYSFEPRCGSFRATEEDRAFMDSLMGEAKVYNLAQFIGVVRKALEAEGKAAV